MVKAVHVLVFALASASAGLPALSQNRLEVREESGGRAVEKLTIVLSDTETTTPRRVLLSRPDGQAQPGIKLEALISGDAGISFTPQPLDIPAGQPVLVTIQVTKSTAGVTTGQLLAQGEAIAKIEIRKAAPTAVALAGADAATGLTLKTEMSDFRHTFRVISTEATPTPARLTAFPFNDPTGIQVQPTLELAGVATSAPIGFEVDQSHPVAVTLGISTPLSGDYSGLLELGFNGLVKPVPVKVTRSRVAPTVAFDPIPQTRVYDWLISEVTAETDVSFRETSGRPTTIDQLILVNVVRKETEADVKADLKAREIRQDRRTVTGPLHVAAGGTARLSVYLRGLPGAGKYEARLRLASGDGTPLESTFIILVRYHWWVFILVVIVAVSLSGLLRWYFTGLRPQLVERIRLSEARVRLNELERQLKQELPTLQPPATDVFTQLRDHIDQLSWETERLRPAAVEPSRKLLELKLANVLVPWVRLRAQTDNETLKAVELYLKRRDPLKDKTPEDETNDQVKNLQKVAEELKTKTRAEAAPWLALEIADAEQLRKQLRKRLLLWEIATSAFACLIASLLGAALLYFPSATWGSLQDVVVAALWGLGLHQVNGKAFEGASWIKQQFGLPAGER